MRLRPNDLPPLVEGEARNVTFKLVGAVGLNTISSASLASDGNGITMGTPTIDGTDVSFLLTAANAGDNYLTLTAILGSGETLKGTVRARVDEERPT